MHTLKAKPQGFEDDLLNRLYTATKLASMTVTTRQNYDKVMWTEIDQIATMTFAKEKAMAEGLAEGRTEGLAEGKAEVAKAMIAKGFSVTDVSECTGLSVEEIAQLNAR